jgi:hypothetical protein
MPFLSNTLKPPGELSISPHKRRRRHVGEGATANHLVTVSPAFFGLKPTIEICNLALVLFLAEFASIHPSSQFEAFGRKRFDQVHIFVIGRAPRLHYARIGTLNGFHIGL